MNVRALDARAPQSDARRRYDLVGRWVTGQPNAGAVDGIRWVRELCAALRIPGLRSYGLTPGDVPLLVEKAIVASSMKANPIVLTPGELAEVLTEALDGV